METRSIVGGAIACHILGEHVHEVHQPKANDKLDITVLVNNVERARAYAKRHMPTGRGRRPDPACEFVVAGCRPDMNREDQDAYFKAALAWIIAKAGPYSMVAAAAIHRHEVSPHMQVLLVPVGMVDERTQVGKTETAEGKVRYRYRATGRKVRGIGWTAVRDRFSAGPGRAADRMSRMQDSFHAEVASRFGIERGEVGSQAVHEEIDRRKAAELLREQAEREEAAARSSAESARADEQSAWAAARQAQERRDTLHDEGVTNLRRKREAEHELAATERELETKRLELLQADSDLAAIKLNRGMTKRRKRERSLRGREQAVEQRETEYAKRRAELDERERELAEGQRKVDEERARQDQRRAELDLQVAAAGSELEEERQAAGQRRQRMLRMLLRLREKARELRSRARALTGLEQREEAVAGERRELARVRRAVEERGNGLEREVAATVTRRVASALATLQAANDGWIRTQRAGIDDEVKWMVEERVGERLQQSRETLAEAEKRQREGEEAHQAARDVLKEVEQRREEAADLLYRSDAGKLWQVIDKWLNLTHGAERGRLLFEQLCDHMSELRRSEERARTPRANQGASKIPVEMSKDLGR